ncbi:fasciclin domain-containing protein [Flavobacterium sp.]|uniref:fasciclin domain-containing protein n=1 Tax=Flavobacterium sp. TaxID=239 RepID=UPI002609BD50|nr:fasciclin domain-containing protein [Flavobacterium sp.]MDG2430929.1 fasciclin domain-containing protein [Flavobacterium sp.]
MKKILKPLLFAVVAALALASCSSDDETTTPTVDNSITGIASANADFSILVQALTRAELASTLQADGDFTVFAPTNAAFTSFLSTAGFASINDVPKDALKEILLNHVITGTIKSTDLSTTYIKTMAKGTASATNNLSMFVNTANNAVKLNGVATVKTADIMASNGVIHSVDAVIGLPTLVTHATANPNFSSLVGALTATGQPDFVSILSGTGPFTVFAPDNAAFTALDAELAPTGIAGVSAANLTKVLQYHVVSGNVLAASLTEGQVVPTLQTPQSFTIELTGGAKIKDANGRMSTITATDVQCANGVIHVINKVLLPTL